MPEMDQSEKNDGNEEENEEWTNEEVVLLVNAIAEHQNDWAEVAEQLPGRAPEQCVLKFLELPLTENMLQKISSSSKT